MARIAGAEVAGRDVEHRGANEIPRDRVGAAQLAFVFQLELAGDRRQRRIDVGDARHDDRLSRRERAPLGVRVMRHGKDFMVDKPGVTSLAQLEEARRAQRETKRIYSIMYSERFENPATVKAGELVKAGAIGKVIQTIGLGPHRINPSTRPAWFITTRSRATVIVLATG